MTRQCQCPSCGAAGPVTAFPLLPPESTPARHDERRRACRSCGFCARARFFVPRPNAVPLGRPPTPRCPVCRDRGVLRGPGPMGSTLPCWACEHLRLDDEPLDQLKRAAGHPALPGMPT